MTLVLDSSVVVRACVRSDGFAAFENEDLASPPLMWSEFRSAVHEALWRRDISHDEAMAMRSNLARAPVVRKEPRRLDSEAWRFAEELGWAKTYDAEYVALASILGCRLITSDVRLRRGANRFGFVIGPNEL